MSKNNYKRAIALLRDIRNAHPDQMGRVGDFLADIDHKPKKRSTTHREKFYFFNTPNTSVTPSGHKIVGGTVFFRKEKDGWFASLALCCEGDQFSRDRGRSWARRRYFAGDRSEVSRVIIGEASEQEPDYEIASNIYFGS